MKKVLELLLEYVHTCEESLKIPFFSLWLELLFKFPLFSLSGEFLSCHERVQPGKSPSSPSSAPSGANNNNKASFNASCFYSPSNESSSALVVHLGDRQVLKPEYFLPGAELVYRCKDIGEELRLLERTLSSNMEDIHAWKAIPSMFL